MCSALIAPHPPATPPYRRPSPPPPHPPPPLPALRVVASFRVQLTSQQLLNVSAISSALTTYLSNVTGGASASVTGVSFEAVVPVGVVDAGAAPDLTVLSGTVARVLNLSSTSVNVSVIAPAGNGTRRSLAAAAAAGPAAAPAAAPADSPGSAQMGLSISIRSPENSSVVRDASTLTSAVVSGSLGSALARVGVGAGTVVMLQPPSFVVWFSTAASYDSDSALAQLQALAGGAPVVLQGANGASMSVIPAAVSLAPPEPAPPSQPAAPPLPVQPAAPPLVQVASSPAAAEAPPTVQLPVPPSLARSVRNRSVPATAVRRAYAPPLRVPNARRTSPSSRLLQQRQLHALRSSARAWSCGCAPSAARGTS